MLSANHALTGALAAAGLCVVFHSPLDVAAIATVATAGAACLPDLDHPEAAVSSTFGALSRTGARLVSRAAGGHRRGTHTVLAAVVAGVLVAVLVVSVPFSAAVVCGVLASFAWRCAAPRHLRVLPLTYLAGAGAGMFAALHPVGIALALAVGGGWLTHLAGDVVTGTGVPMLLPLSAHKISLPILGQVDSAREHIARVVLIVALALTTWAGVHNTVLRAVRA